MFLIATAATVTLTMPLAAESPHLIDPGLWEVTIRTESPVPSSPMTTTVCISSEKAKKPPEPPKHKESDDCKVTGGGVTGNVLAYSLKCSKRNATSTFRFEYHGDTYEGIVETKTDAGEVRQIYSGRRVGECDAESQVPRP